MKSFFHQGAEAEADEQVNGAETFDPIAALDKLGMAAPAPIEVEEVDDEITPAPRGIAPDENGIGDARGGDTLDLSSFKTVETSAREDMAALGAATYHGQPYDPEPEAPAPVGINPKDLIGATKPDISLVPPAGILYESQAMMDGAAKYGPYNWRSNPVLYRVYIAAAIRHLQQLLDGEDFDPISGVHHVGHARACLGIIADANETGNLIDDRPPSGPSGAMIRRFGDTGTYRK